MVAAIAEKNHGLADIIDASRCVSAKKLLRITAFVLHFINSCRKKNITKAHHLPMEEIQNAKSRWNKERCFMTCLYANKPKIFL